MSRASGRSRMRLRKARRSVPEKLRWVDAAMETATDAGEVEAGAVSATAVALREGGYWEDVGNRQQRRVLAAMRRQAARR